MPIDPRGMDFAYWSARTSASIAGLGYVPTSAPEEKWRNFAHDIQSAPQLSALALPDPRDFPDWRDWAFRLNEALRAIGL